MKRINFMAVALCLIFALVSCKSEEQKIAEKYIMEKDYPTVIAAVALMNGEVVSMTVENFSDEPTDTLFEWQVFRIYDLQWAAEEYLTSVRNLTDLYDFKAEMTESFGRYFDSTDTDERIKEMTETARLDSIAYEVAEAHCDSLEASGEIRALGYSFDEKVVMKLAGQKRDKTTPKVIYIMENGEVYSCKDR